MDALTKWTPPEPPKPPEDPFKAPLAKHFVEEVMENLYSSEMIYGKRVEEVESEFRDGFIPYTDGGFEGIGYQDLSYDWSSGNAPAVIQPYIDSSLKSAEQDWDEQNPQHTVAWLYQEDPEAAGQHVLFDRSTEREHWREKWYEFESEWMSEGGTYFYKVRALFYGVDNRRNQNGDEPEVYFFVGINTDFEYGRDNIPWLACYGGNPQQSQWLWEETVPVSKITPELIEGFIEKATEALRNA